MKRKQLPRKLEEVYESPFAAQGIPGGLEKAKQDARRREGRDSSLPGAWVPGYKPNAEPESYQVPDSPKTSLKKRR